MTTPMEQPRRLLMGLGLFWLLVMLPLAWDLGDEALREPGAGLMLWGMVGLIFGLPAGLAAGGMLVRCEVQSTGRRIAGRGVWWGAGVVALQLAHWLPILSFGPAYVVFRGLGSEHRILDAILWFMAWGINGVLAALLAWTLRSLARRNADASAPGPNPIRLPTGTLALGLGLAFGFPTGWVAWNLQNHQNWTGLVPAWGLWGLAGAVALAWTAEAWGKREGASVLGWSLTALSLSPFLLAVTAAGVEDTSDLRWGTTLVAGAVIVMSVALGSWGRTKVQLSSRTHGG